MTQEEYQPVLVVAVNQLSLFGAELFLFEVWGAAIVDRVDWIVDDE